MVFDKKTPFMAKNYTRRKFALVFFVCEMLTIRKKDDIIVSNDTHCEVK